MTIRVREAIPEDAESLVSLSREFDAEGEVVSDVAHVVSQIESNPTERVLIAESDGTPVGFATLQLTRSFCYERPTAELTGIFVRPDYRRNGVASALLERAKQAAEDEGALELFLRVHRANAGAIAFYESESLSRAEHYVYRFRYY